MRIAWLCKRRYMSKDVVADRYGRLYELPRRLAERGHDVLGICLDYHGSSHEVLEHEVAGGRLRWRTRALGRAILPGLLAHCRDALGELRAFDPDVVIGSSDSYHVVLGSTLARRLSAPYAVDLYDNFESFGLTRVPGLRGAFRRAVRGAQAVSCVSAPLRDHVRSQYRAQGEAILLESTITPGAFQPMDRTACLQRFGLAPDLMYVGYAGALDASRGIADLYGAFEMLASERSDVRLLLAGPIGSPPVPSSTKVSYLGMLGHADVPAFFGALDVGVLCMVDSAFGRFSFPQKAYEMLSMRIPLVVARVGAMRALLEGWPACTYGAGDAVDLHAKLAAQLRQPVVPRVDIPDWAHQAERLEALLRRAVDQSGARARSSSRRA